MNFLHEHNLHAKVILHTLNAYLISRHNYCISMYKTENTMWGKSNDMEQLKEMKDQTELWDIE